MPSVRSANFTDDYDTQRCLPPASLELRAPADKADRADARFRREHPAKRGRPSEEPEEQEGTVMTVFEALRKDATPKELAEDLGSSEGRAKRLIKQAKTTLAERIGEYADAHLVATKIAAVSGDAKPAQWALENIEAEGERAVTPPSKTPAPTTAPTFNLGFMIGGMPMQPAQVVPISGHLPPAKPR